MNNELSGALKQAIATNLGAEAATSDEGFVGPDEATRRIDQRTKADTSPAAISTGRVNQFDFVYRQTLHQIMYWGQDRGNRTGMDSRSCFGTMLKFDLRENTFPMLTLRRIPLKSIVAELIGFLRGYTSAAQFREIGTSIWDANANQNEVWLKNTNRKGEDDLGRIYGAQWRDWSTYKDIPAHSEGSEWITKETVRRSTDQFKHLLHCLRHNRSDRRMIVSAWNPGELDQMALPPCHMMFQCYVTHDSCLDLIWYQRSVDTVLGAPFNIASYALLTHILCGLVPDLKPGTLTASWGDYHVYHNHFDGVAQMLGRTGHVPPTLHINWPSDDPIERQNWLENAPGPEVVAAFELHDYVAEPAIKFEMAV